MAISIDFQGAPVQPVYNPFYFQVQSSNYLQPQFRFLFDVYKDGVYVQRVKMLPKPGTNIQIFSPARILESYLSYDILTQENLIQSQTNSIAHFAVKYGEEYGPTSAAPVLYTNLAQSSGYTWNATVQYENYYNSESGIPTVYHYLKNTFLYSGIGKFLTNAPTGVTIGYDDNHSLSCFNFNTADVADANVEKAAILTVKTYQSSGGSIESLYLFGANTGSTIAYKLLHFPAGPKNLAAMPFANMLSGKYPSVNTETDYKYEVYLKNASNDTISETRLFEFQECAKYDQVRLMFLNRLGGWDYFNFRLVSRTTINSTKNTYKKNIPISYYYGNTVANRETTVLSTQNMKSKRVTSNWVTDEESAWLEELWTSNEVYEIQDDPIYVGIKKQVPVVITTSTQEIKKRVNDQLYNYEVEFQYASEVNTQRN
jgi:hypothetical protein